MHAGTLHVAATTSSELFRYHGEQAFNLTQYMVHLAKPLGLTIAPDPDTGQIVIQQVHKGFAADLCKLIQVGDVLRYCSATYGDEMTECNDLQRIKWAITHRDGHVKLILERPAVPSKRTWSCTGNVGMATFDQNNLQLPVRFTSAVPMDVLDVADLGLNKGKIMTVAFHRSLPPPQKATRPHSSLLARSRRATTLREDMLQALEAPEIEMTAMAARVLASGGERVRLQYNNASGSTAAPTAVAAQNGAVPFRRADGRLVQSPGASGGGLRFTGIRRADTLAKEKKVVQLLPWLMVSNSRLGTKDITRLASARGLAGLLELGLQSFMGMLTVRGCGDASLSPHQAIALTAAALQRLVVRRRLRAARLGPWDALHILLHCEEGIGGEVATLLAGWLTWYGMLERQEAVWAAEQVMGTAVAQPLLDAATRWLAESARERRDRVLLTWPHGGLSVDIAGELVGGWMQRVPLQRTPPRAHGSRAGVRGAGRLPSQGPGAGAGPARQGQEGLGLFSIELKGLSPGVYHYKYIVDGCWAVDPFAPKALDNSGNLNNILAVQEITPLKAVDELYLSRLQAAHLALDNKLGLPTT